MSAIARERGFGKWMNGRHGNAGTWKKGQFAKEKHPFWKGGVTTLNATIRASDEYKKWRTAVFERDDYRCQWCSSRGGKLHADHIMPFALHPSRRLDVNNGRTLCVACHKERTSIQMTVLWKNQFANAPLNAR